MILEHVRAVGQTKRGIFDAAKWRDFGNVLVIFLTSRLVFYAVALLSDALIPLAPRWSGQMEISPHPWLGLHWRWDALHYYSVALGGYAPAIGPLPTPDVETRSAFFPLFPLLSRGLAELLGVIQPHALDTRLMLSGVIVAHAGALLAFVLLFQLVREETGSEETAQRAVLYTAMFPLAFFYAVPYAESLFLATSIGAYLAMRRQQWLRAGIWIALAAATRPFGVLLIPVLALEIGLTWWRGTPIVWWRAAFGILVAPVGILLFMGELWYQMGDSLAFAHAQSVVWHRTDVFPLATLWRGLQLALHPSLSFNANTYAITLVHTVTVFGFLLILLVSIRRWRPAYVLYGILLFIQVLSVPWPPETIMHTLGRSVMVLFPVYITLAQWGRRSVVHHAIMVLSAPLFGLLTMLYVRWYFVA